MPFTQTKIKLTIFVQFFSKSNLLSSVRFSNFLRMEFRQGKQCSLNAYYYKIWSIKLFYMPFKDKLIKEIQKSINMFLESNSSQPLSNNQSKQSQVEAQKQKRGINNHRKFLTAKIRNIYQLFLRKMPANSVHVVNFYNMLTINQEALLSQDFQQSYFRTTFYLKSIKRVQSRPNCLILHLIQSDYSFAPIQYSISRFKSFGDQKFYTLACQMEEIISKFKTIKNHAGKQHVKEENNEKFDKYLHSLGNRMFVLKTSNKFALSRSFMELLQYSPEEYSIQAVKYRSSLYEGCTTKNYFQIMSKSLQNIQKLIDLLFDKISLQTFLDTSIIRLKDILYTKSDKKIYAKVKAGMPNPFTTIYQVEQVISVSDQLYNKKYFEGEKRKHLNTLKQQFRNSGVRTVKNLMELPPSYLPENKHLVTNYIQKVAEGEEAQSSL